MKFTVAQHKEHLKNMNRFLDEKRATVASLNKEIERLRKDCNALDAQIIEAELRCVDGFDSERFGIKKTGKLISATNVSSD